MAILSPSILSADYMNMERDLRETAAMGVKWLHVDIMDGLPAHKLHCSVLAEEAIKSALKDYYDKNGIAYDKKLFPDCENCGHCH